MNKKKTLWGILIILSVIVLIAGILIYLNKEDTPPAPAQPSTVIKEEVKDKLSYENLAGLNYTLLRSEKMEGNGVDVSLLLDIQVEKSFTEDEFTSLGKEAYNVLSKEVGKEKTISNVYINVFTTKEAFDKTMQEDYKGDYVEGLIHSSFFEYEEENHWHMMLRTFDTIQLDKDVESIQDSLDFEVVDANEIDNGKQIQANVIIAPGEKALLEDMIQGITSMIKESNDNSEHVTLFIYNSKDDYNNGIISFQYSTINPNMIVIEKDLSKHP